MDRVNTDIFNDTDVDTDVTFRPQNRQMEGAVGGAPEDWVGELMRDVSHQQYQDPYRQNQIENEIKELRAMIADRDRQISCQINEMECKDREVHNMKSAVEELGQTLEKIKYEREQERRLENPFASPDFDGIRPRIPRPNFTMGDSVAGNFGSPWAELQDSRVARPEVKEMFIPDKYQGHTSLSDYLIHFEMCTEINGWNDREKAKYLAVSLRGPAQRLLSTIEKTKIRDYDAIVSALEERFGTEGQSAIYMAQLQSKVKGEKENFQELSENVAKLVSRAYPTAPGDMVKILTLQHFIEAVPNRELRTKLKLQKLKNVREAVLYSIEYEAIENSEQSNSGQKRPVREVKTEGKDDHEGNTGKKANKGAAGSNASIESVTDNLTKMIAKLEEKLAKMDKGQKRPKIPLEEVRCYNCNNMGHYASKCDQEDRRKAKTNEEPKNE